MSAWMWRFWLKFDWNQDDITSAFYFLVFFLLGSKEKVGLDLAKNHLNFRYSYSPKRHSGMLNIDRHSSCWNWFAGGQSEWISMVIVGKSLKPLHLKCRHFLSLHSLLKTKSKSTTKTKTIKINVDYLYLYIFTCYLLWFLDVLFIFLFNARKQAQSRSHANWYEMIWRRIRPVIFCFVFYILLFIVYKNK